MLNPNADNNASDRVDRSKLGLDYFVANPLGDYVWSQRFYLVDLGPEPFEPHNFVAQILSQQGIAGFAFLALMLGSTLRIAWCNRNKDRMSAVMLACLSFYLVFCLFNTNILNPWNIMLLVVPIGLILDRNDALAAGDRSSEGDRVVVRGSVGSGPGRQSTGLTDDAGPGLFAP